MLTFADTYWQKSEMSDESVRACSLSDIVRKMFCDLLSESVNKKKDNNFYLTTEKYNSLLNEVKEAKSVKGKQTVQHRLLKRYDILNIGGEEKLTVPFYVYWTVHRCNS